MASIDSIRNRFALRLSLIIAIGCLLELSCPAQIPFGQKPQQETEKKAAEKQSDNEEQSTDVTLETLLPIHLEAAKSYTIYSDATQTHELTLREQPVSQWVNQRRSGGQLGHVFVWMDGETPAALGAMFSFPWGGVMTDRRIVHEFQALSETKLIATRGRATSRWEPKSALKRISIPKTHHKVSSFPRFNIALRQVARRFSGHCIDSENQRWELRALPKPLMTYPIRRSNGDHGFGAVIGMMGDVGNDLESGFLVEAITSQADSTSTSWSFAPIRMTDMTTHMSIDDQVVWESLRSETDTRFYDANHTYFRFQDKTVRMK